MVLLLVAFLAGVLTIASPCVLPILPVLLSGTVGGRGRPIGIIVGFLLSFVFFTLFLSSLVRLLGIGADTLRVFSIALLMVFGLVLVVPALHQRFERLTSSMGSVGGLQKGPQDGFVGGLLMGLSLGLLWTPCVGPILASVITLALNGTVTAQTAAITTAYALGAAIPMVAVMLGGRALLNRVPGLFDALGGLQRSFGVLLVVFGAGMFLGWDRQLQTWFVENNSGYLNWIFSLEDARGVQDGLQDLQKQ